jgi:hypothetical protein
MFIEDLTVFFKDFGVEVIFKRGVTTLFTPNPMMIFDAPPTEVNVYDRSFYDEKFYEARVQGKDVRLQGIETELVGLQLNDVATVGGHDWYVIAIEPDGTGLTVIRLSESTAY